MVRQKTVRKEQGVKKQLTRKKTALEIEENQDESNFRIEKLRWWKQGSNNNEEHGYRMTSSNIGIRLHDLKEMENEAKELLRSHQTACQFY